MTEVIAENQKLKVELLQLKSNLNNITKIINDNLEELENKKKQCEEFSYEYYLYDAMLKNYYDLVDKLFKYLVVRGKENEKV